ncbi:MAG TPA: TraR/DksA C4-type zinc finger protein [Bryobacteraceae bacterium]|nr:TraR/DksA C4-type zinc finger protein [Bryobacteraceae bacterium]
MKTILAPVAEGQESYRLRLMERRKEVLSGLGMKFDTLASMGRVAEDDQAQISHDEFVSLHLNRIDYGELRLVEEALDRLESGDYGLCLSCEEPIPAKRLKAVPWARHCIRCAEAPEAGTEDWNQPRPRPVGLKG